MKQSLRVLMVIRQFHPLVGGAELFAERLAIELIAQGCPTSIVTARIERGWPKREKLEDQLEVVRLPAPRMRFVGSLVFVTALLLHFIRHRRHFDLIHVHHADYATFAAALAGRLLRKPVVCQLHGTGKVGDISQLRHSPVSSLKRWSLRTVDRLVVISSAMRTEVLAAGFSESQVLQIPDGVDVQAFEPATSKQSSQGKQIVYVGRLSFEKGPDVLIDAFRLLVKRHHKMVQLTFVGDGGLRQLLERQVKDCGLKHLVQFLGNASDVRPYLHAADAYVLPSRSEGLSVALLEAMACGLPVVATRSGGPVDVVEDGTNGLLVEPEDPEALAGAIQRVLDDRHLACQLGCQARRTVEEKYSLQSVAERYIRLYSKLLTRRHL